MSYLQGTGKYQALYNYYTTLNSSEKHKYIFDCISLLFTSIHSLQLPTDQVLLGVQKIRDTPGLAKCWGYALNILKELPDCKTEQDFEKLKPDAERLLDVSLEALPAYCKYTVEPVYTANQKIIAALQSKANYYRVIGDRRFTMFDAAVQAVSAVEHFVSINNFKYLPIDKKIHSFMAKNLVDCVDGKAEEEEEPVTMDLDQLHKQMLTDSLTKAGYSSLADEISDHGFPQVLTDFLDYENYNERAVEEIFYSEMPDGCPIPLNWRNKVLVRWLWENYELFLVKKQKNQCIDAIANITHSSEFIRDPKEHVSKHFAQLYEPVSQNEIYFSLTIKKRRRKNTTSQPSKKRRSL